MALTKYFSDALTRREVLATYHKWLIQNKPLYSKYFSVFSMLFMALLIPFDFILFSNGLVYTRFRVIAIILYALNVYLLSLKKKPPGNLTKDKFQFMLVFPALFFCILYEYFLFFSPRDHYSTVLIANYMVIFFATFSHNRFWKEQYFLSGISLLGLGVLFVARNDITRDLLLLSIFHLCSMIIAFFFRREFVKTMYVTVLEQSKKDLQAAKEQAEASDKLKSIFLGIISHEIRTPLNAMVGYTDLLQMSLEDKINQDEKGYINVINQGKDRLLRLIDDILDLSQIEAGEFVLKYENVIGYEIVRDFLLEMSIEIEESELDLIKKYNGKEAKINVDITRFQQILGNLITNAIKYTPEGNITVQTDANKSEFKVSISDTGIGIKEEFKPHLFSLFRQEEEGFSRTYEGAGLGLSITKRLIKSMNGRIEVESFQGVGSTFTVYFPRIDKTLKAVKRIDGELELEKKQRSAQLQQIPSNNGELIIIEDNQSNLKYLEDSLKNLGYNYLSTTSGEKALELLDGREISCILVDIGLSGKMDGVDFLQCVKKTEQYKNIPLIAVTAHAMKGMREQFLERGFDDFLPKPFTINSLRDILDRNLFNT